MLDSAEIAAWEHAYFDGAMKLEPRRITHARLLRIRRWARAMALIAEQHRDDDLDREGAEATA
jgi:hypothetical protein